MPVPHTHTPCVVASVARCTGRGIPDDRTHRWPAALVFAVQRHTQPRQWCTRTLCDEANGHAPHIATSAIAKRGIMRKEKSTCTLVPAVSSRCMPGQK